MLAADAYEQYETPEPEGCNCEQALQVTCDALKLEVSTLRAALEQAGREGFTLAQAVLQGETAEEKNLAARVYLGLEAPF